MKNIITTLMRGETVTTKDGKVLKLDEKFRNIKPVGNTYLAMCNDMTLNEVLDYLQDEIIDAAGMSIRHHQCTFDEYDPKENSESFKLFKEYAKNPVTLGGTIGFKSALLFGSVGTGKTHLIHALANEWAYNMASYEFRVEASEQYYKTVRSKYTYVNPPSEPTPFVIEVRYTMPRYHIYREQDILLRIRNTFNRKNIKDDDGECLDIETEDDIYSDLARPQIIAIDDMVKYTPSNLDFYQRVMFQIIDSRYNAGKGVVISTNKNPKELIQYLGEATVDRIYEMTQGYQLEFKGKSHRTTKPEVNQ